VYLQMATTAEHTDESEQEAMKEFERKEAQNVAATR